MRVRAEGGVYLVLDVKSHEIFVEGNLLNELHEASFLGVLFVDQTSSLLRWFVLGNSCVSHLHF